MSLEEIRKIVNGNSELVGGMYFGANSSNNHKYKPNVRYLHFFKNLNDLPLIQQIRENLDEKCLCEFNIPLYKLIAGSGHGIYFDKNSHGYDEDISVIKEYAIESKKIIPEYLVDFIEDYSGKLTPKDAKDRFELFRKEKGLE